MGCHHLQLTDYFQAVENVSVKYREARFSGNPVLASRRDAETQSVLFNDMLGTTLGAASRDSTGSTYVSAQLTAFGEPITPNAQRTTPNELFFTGKPKVEGLGYAFLFRNYRANLGKFVCELTKELATESEATPNGNCRPPIR